MTDENVTDSEANNDNTNGIVENYHQLPPPPPPPPPPPLLTPLKTILETSCNSTIERSIHNVLRKHFLEQRPITWKPIKVELIVNTQLTDDFFLIRKRFEKGSGGNRYEFEEHYGFLIENDAQVSDICNNGYHCTETSFNVLGHSKCGVYVCKYADVCIRQASVRRTWEGSMTIKMIIFKIVEGKQTAALVRKGPKLQPIAPTPQFTSHCSVITPKETDDLEKQFDQSQIFLYEFEGRETIKRPHHCLPYAIVSLIQDGTQWPVNFDDFDVELGVLETDTLRVIAQTDDQLLQNKLKENIELAEAATRALEHIYEEEPLPPPPTVADHVHLPSTNSEILLTTTMSDNTSASVVNGIGTSASLTISNDNSSTTSPSPIVVLTNNTDASLNSLVQPPPPPPSSSTATIVATSKTPATAVATTIPLTHSAAAVQAAYRQQTSLLGALPSAAALRGASNAVYSAPAGFANGMNGSILYGGVSLDALRGYSTGTTGASPYVFAAHAGQSLQQPALYAAQLQAVAQQQQAVQFAAAQQQQQQQQQNLINSIPAGYMLVRTANGGYALLGNPTGASTAAMQPQAQASLAQQQYISFNAAGQPTATTSRYPVAMVGGQSQQLVYQYAGQPTGQATPTQYIQVPANYVQQQLSTSPIMQAAASTGSQAYTSQIPTEYIRIPQAANNNNNNNNNNNINTASIVSSSNVATSSSSAQSQQASTLISPQKQSAASATAAALQQQQQYQHSQYAQHNQQQPVNSAHGANVYYAAIAQAQAQLTAQVQAQQQQQQQQQVAAAYSQQQQQQQQLNFISQMQYGTQQGVPQQMYYATSGGQTIYQAGGQSYVLAQASPTAGTTTTTGAPAMYSAGPALHNGSAQQQSQQHASQSQQQQQQQQQLAYQIAAATGQSAAAAYQMINAASNASAASQQQTTAAAGVVAQQPAQLVQRSGVLPQVRHHPYRN
ncbi:unnamed protein product [Rotaria magnacalcarata]